MTEPRQLGVVRNYQDLLGIMRGRAVELELTRETIDALALLQPGYASKLLAPQPMKVAKWETLADLLPALGIKLVAVPDDDAVEIIRKRGYKRDANRASHASVITITRSARFYREIGRKGGIARAMSLRARKAQTAKARAARWNSVTVSGGRKPKPLSSP